MDHYLVPPAVVAAPARGSGTALTTYSYLTDMLPLPITAALCPQYAQHLGSDPDALETEIRLQVKAQMQEQLDALLERARRAEQLAKSLEKRLAESEAREKELQALVQALRNRPVGPADPDPDHEERLRAAIEAEVRDKIRRELEEQLRAEMRDTLKDELRRELEEQMRAEIEAALRKELEDRLRKEVEAQLRAELEERLRAEVEAKLREELEDSLRSELEEALRTEIEAALRPQLEEAIRAEIEARMKAEMEEQVKGLEESSSAGVAQLQALLQERERQLQQAVAHAQASLQALTAYLRTRRESAGTTHQGCRLAAYDGCPDLAADVISLSHCRPNIWQINSDGPCPILCAFSQACRSAMSWSRCSVRCSLMWNSALHQLTHRCHRSGWLIE